jgi:hypothetical protein
MQLQRVGTRLLGAVVVPRLKSATVAAVRTDRTGAVEYNTEAWITTGQSALDAPTRRLNQLTRRAAADRRDQPRATSRAGPGRARVKPSACRESFQSTKRLKGLLACQVSPRWTCGGSAAAAYGWGPHRTSPATMRSTRSGTSISHAAGSSEASVATSQADDVDVRADEHDVRLGGEHVTRDGGQLDRVGRRGRTGAADQP